MQRQNLTPIQRIEALEREVFDAEPGEEIPEPKPKEEPGKKETGSIFGNKGK